MARGKLRDHLLEVGIKLFRERGYNATGIQDLAAAAGMPKGSFYNYFGSKQEFAVAVLESYGARSAAVFQHILQETPGSPLTRIRALFELQRRRIADGNFREACLAGRLAQELAGEQPAFRSPLERAFGCLAERLSAVLTEAQVAGEIAPEHDVAQLADFLVCSWQGALMRAKTAGSDAPIQRFFDYALGHLLRSGAPAQ